MFEGKFQAPKTLRALRTIPLGPHAMKALKEHQVRVARKGDDDLVFGNRKGGPLRESKLLTNVLQPAAQAGLHVVESGLDAGLERLERTRVGSGGGFVSRHPASVTYATVG